MKKILLFCLVVVLGFASCIEDNGNYDYHDINIVSIDIPTTTLVKLEPQTFRLDITDYITQSMATDNENLSYRWWHSTTSFVAASALQDEEKIISRKSYVEMEIDPETFADFNNFYRLMVDDELTGVSYPVNVGVKVVKPYEGAWMVMHNSGGTKVGGVEFEEDGTATTTLDVFARADKPGLTGNPVRLGVNTQITAYWEPMYTPPAPSNNYAIFYAITDDVDEAANYCQWMMMTKTRPIADMPQDKNLITSEKLSKMTHYFGQGFMVMSIMDGEFYHGRNGLRLYKAPMDATVTGDTRISHGQLIGASVSILYDEVGRRFLWFNHGGNINSPGASPIWSYTPTNYREANENRTTIKDMNRAANDFTLNPLPADRKVLYLGTGTRNGSSRNYDKSFAIAMGTGAENSNDLYIYEFPAGYTITQTGNKSIDAVKQKPRPAALTAESSFASTYLMNGIIFFSSGSKVYRYDYNLGSAMEIYDHGSGVIKKIEFARRQAADTGTGVHPDYTPYGFDVCRSLGVMVETGSNSGELVVLDIAESGLLSGGTATRPAKQVFTGFGKMVDIVFI